MSPGFGSGQLSGWLGWLCCDAWKGLNPQIAVTFMPDVALAAVAPVGCTVQEIGRLEEEISRLQQQLDVSRASEEELHRLVTRNDAAYGDAKRLLILDFEARMEDVSGLSMSRHRLRCLGGRVTALVRPRLRRCRVGAVYVLAGSASVRRRKSTPMR